MIKKEFATGTSFILDVESFFFFSFVEVDHGLFLYGVQ